MIDIHCHLLPGIDDGPPTLEAALALARDLVLDGMSHVVCTPHVFPGRFENRSSSIEEDFARFTEVLESSGIPLALSWAGEVRLTPEVLDLLAMGEVPFLGESGGYRSMLRAHVLRLCGIILMINRAPAGHVLEWGFEIDAQTPNQLDATGEFLRRQPPLGPVDLRRTAECRRWKLDGKTAVPARGAPQSCLRG